jgi:hypothetical protein
LRRSVHTWHPTPRQRRDETPRGTVLTSFYLITKGVLFVREKQNLAVWAGVYTAGSPRDDHRLDLHPPTNRFLTERACDVFGHSCSPDSASTQHRLRAHGRKPVNVASLSTSCPHASNEASGIGVEFKGSRLGSPDFLPRSCRGKLQLPKQRCSTMWLRAPALALKAAGARKSMLVESHPPGPHLEREGTDTGITSRTASGDDAGAAGSSACFWLAHRDRDCQE